MGYYPWSRRPPKPAPKPPLPRPVLSGMAEEYRDREYLGASSGEFTMGIVEPPPQPKPWVGPPPVDWEEEERERQARGDSEPETVPLQPGGALAALRQQLGEEAYQPRFSAEPPVTTAPLVPVKIPEWPEEDRRREELERERAQRHPAPPRREPA